MPSFGRDSVRFKNNSSLTSTNSPLVVESHHRNLQKPIIEETANLPIPPNDDEKYRYVGPQKRWLLVAQFISFVLVAFSMFRFAISDTKTLLFVIPISLFAITMVISLFSSTRPRRVSHASHTHLVASYTPASYPSVDVFLPSAGEPLDLLENTYYYVSKLNYPGDLKVYVLDDSNRLDVEQMAARYGFDYHVRPNRGHLKKAGNLKYGWSVSTGDFILVLDADFAPRRDMLNELIPYFEDDSVGIVQSPQYFDTDRTTMHWLQRSAGATQELFYRWIQPSRDSLGAAICVGTCAMYRRAALKESGGFAQIGHSEDVHTGVNLLRVGKNLRYVPVLLAKGICPDRLSGFLNQQYRWCTGSMSLLADDTFHEEPHIKTRHRICFWSGFLYYISTAVNAIFAPLPALTMLYFYPEWIEPMNSIWFVGALVLWFVLLPMAMVGTWRIDVLRVHVLYSFSHLVAIKDILVGSTKEWVATGTANGRKTPIADSIANFYEPYIAITFILLWGGLAKGIYHYGFENFWAMTFLAVIASYVQLPVLFARRIERVTNN